jgi:hypothetical protein
MNVPYENVTPSTNTRLPSFVADRQSAVLKTATEALGGLSAIRKYPKTAFEEVSEANRSRTWTINALFVQLA